MSSLSRQRRVTEFQPEELFLSLTLTDKRQTNKPNVSPSCYQMKFWGLLAMVAPTAHITQQNSLIGSSSKIKPFHWLQCSHQYLSAYMISPNKSFTTQTPSTYIHDTHLTFLRKNLQAYNIGDSV